MDTQTSRLEGILQRLRARGFRITPQRLAIVRLALADARHPSVEELYESIRRDFPTTSLATVYKTLTLLREMGEVNVVDGCQGVAHYDGLDPSPHAHLICLRCGRIADLALPALDNLRQTVAQGIAGWKLSQGPNFYGICPRCRGQEPAGEAKDHLADDSSVTRGRANE